MPITKQQLESLIPIIIQWAEDESANALKHGEPLNEKELGFARKIGIQFPQKIRLLKSLQMPKPPLPNLVNIAAEKGLEWSNSKGMCLGYAIFVREDFWREPRLIAHELAHTFQYERHGGLSLLNKFVIEYLIDGYPNSSLEQEAIEIEQRLFAEPESGLKNSN